MVCFVPPSQSQFGTLEVSGGQICFVFCKHSMIDFAGEMAGNCFPPCRSGSNWWIKPKELPKTMPPWQISTARTSHKGAITSLRTCSACTKRWESSHSCTTHWVLDCKLLFFLLVPRDWLWDPWRSAQGAPRIAHRNEDPSQLPVRI